MSEFKDVYKLIFMDELTFPNYKFMSFKDVMDNFIYVENFDSIFCEYDYKEREIRLIITEKNGLISYYKTTNSQIADIYGVDSNYFENFIKTERSKYFRKCAIDKLLDN